MKIGCIDSGRIFASSPDDEQPGRELRAIGDTRAEAVEEFERVGGRVVEDLAGEEAVLGREIALDVDETADALGPPAGEQEGGQATHRMAEQVERVEVEVVTHGFGNVDEERDRQRVGVGDGRSPEPGCVDEHELAIGEVVTERQVGVVLLGAPEAVEAEERRLRPRPVEILDLRRRVAHVHLDVVRSKGCARSCRHR